MTHILRVTKRKQVIFDIYILVQSADEDDKEGNWEAF